MGLCSADRIEIEGILADTRQMMISWGEWTRIKGLPPGFNTPKTLDLPNISDPQAMILSAVDRELKLAAWYGFESGEIEAITREWLSRRIELGDMPEAFALLETVDEYFKCDHGVMAVATRLRVKKHKAERFVAQSVAWFESALYAKLFANAA